LLVGAALVVCVVGVGAFIFAEVHHYNPLWVFFSGISIVFLAGAREDYRKEFRSPRFVFFVLVWLVINIVIIVVVLRFLRWVYLIPALIIEQGLFYKSAYSLFGVRPGSSRQS
jgi:hypothetical protein